ncbi:MAG: hypothetical protein ACW98X_16020 [Promethearchaeota archaeon]|jgi:hypothetical protein
MKTKQGRFCGNCRKEYNIDDFTAIYPESNRNQAMKVWDNQQVQFFCCYCYLLEILKKIKNKKNNLIG